MTDLSPTRQPDPATADPATADPLAGEALLPVPVPDCGRHDGWTAEKQRLFLQVLAETGCVSDAAGAAGMTPRSAYRLRARADADAFDRAWTMALGLATHRLTAIAWDRAINGVERGIWHKGQCVGVERVPSERLLMFLLRAHDPFAHKVKLVYQANPRLRAREKLIEEMKALRDADDRAVGERRARGRAR